MKNFNRHKFIFVGLISSLLYIKAGFAYFCSTSTGRGYINLGDSMAQVTQMCGTPTSTQVTEVPDGSFSTVEYWSYTRLKVTRAVPLGVNQPDPQVAALGPSITFEIQNGQVTAISENGQASTMTEQCGIPIAIGATADTILSNCGTPTSTNMQNTPNKKTKKITSWVYDRGQYTTPLTLQFDETGALAAINE